MKIGDRVKCVRSVSPDLYSVGSIYVIEGFAGHGMLLRDDTGALDNIPIPMQGNYWDFEPVDEEEQTKALIQILEISQKDFQEGRVMTREEVLERLKKD